MNGDGRGRRRLLGCGGRPPLTSYGDSTRTGIGVAPEGGGRGEAALGHLGYVRRPETEPMWEAGSRAS